MLAKLLSATRSGVAVVAIAAVAFIVGTQFAFLRLCAWAWTKGQQAWVHAQAWGTSFIERQRERHSKGGEKLGPHRVVP